MSDEKQRRALEAIYDDARTRLGTEGGEARAAYEQSLINELIELGYDPRHAEVTIRYFAQLGPKRTITVPLT